MKPNVIAVALAFFAVTTIARAAEPVVAASPEGSNGQCLRAATRSSPPTEARLGHVAQFLQGGDINAADKYLAPEYHQHNPNAETGLEGSQGLLSAPRADKRHPPKDSIDRLVAIWPRAIS